MCTDLKTDDSLYIIIFFIFAHFLDRKSENYMSGLDFKNKYILYVIWVILHIYQHICRINFQKYSCYIRTGTFLILLYLIQTLTSNVRACLSSLTLQQYYHPFDLCNKKQYLTVVLLCISFECGLNTSLITRIVHLFPF